jgi:hypothetical protein
VVVHKVLRATLLAKVLDRVGPQYIAHESGRRRLAKSIELQGGHRSRGRSEGGDEGEGLTLRMSSIVCSSGEIPPCMHKNCLFMTAARGNAQNDWIQASYTRSEYLCLHSVLKVK